MMLNASANKKISHQAQYVPSQPSQQAGAPTSEIAQKTRTDGVDPIALRASNTTTPSIVNQKTSADKAADHAFLILQELSQMKAENIPELTNQGKEEPKKGMPAAWGHKNNAISKATIYQKYAAMKQPAPMSLIGLDDSGHEVYRSRAPKKGNSEDIARFLDHIQGLKIKKVLNLADDDNKSARYFEGGDEQYKNGNTILSAQSKLLNSNSTDNDSSAITKREVTLKVLDDSTNIESEYTFEHYDVANWEDGAGYNSAELMNTLIKQFNKTPGSNVIHCAQGIGRTGVLLACQKVQSLFDQDKDIDVKSIINDLRKAHFALVQTPIQVRFIEYYAEALKKHASTGQWLEFEKPSDVTLSPDLNGIDDSKNIQTSLLKNLPTPAAEFIRVKGLEDFSLSVVNSAKRKGNMLGQWKASGDQRLDHKIRANLIKNLSAYYSALVLFQIPKNITQMSKEKALESIKQASIDCGLTCKSDAIELFKIPGDSGLEPLTKSEIKLLQDVTDHSFRVLLSSILDTDVDLPMDQRFHQQTNEHYDNSLVTVTDSLAYRLLSEKTPIPASLHIALVTDISLAIVDALLTRSLSSELKGAQVLKEKLSLQLPEESIKSLGVHYNQEMAQSAFLVFKDLESNLDDTKKSEEQAKLDFNTKRPATRQIHETLLKDQT